MCGWDAVAVVLDSHVELLLELLLLVLLLLLLLVLVALVDCVVTAISAPPLVMELLHCTPYHVVDDEGVVSLSLLDSLEQGFVVVIQLVLSRHDDFPFVDRYNTFKLYFSRK